jgi:hypothetical protein
MGDACRMRRGKMRKIKVVIFGVGALIALSFSALSIQPSQWKGRIESIDGVKIVRNPNSPVFGDLKLDLQEDLKIDRADDNNYLFYRLRGIDVDADSNIFVADMGNFRIQKFDKTGKYLLTFGRKGQGPGEFDLPTAVHIEEKTGNVLVQDMAVIEIFAPGAKPIRAIKPEHFNREFQIAPDGSIIALMMITVDTQVTHRLGKLAADGKVVQTFVEAPYTIHVERRGESVLSLTNGQELAISFDLLDKQAVIYGYSKEYELAVTDFSGKVLYRISKDEPYPKFTAKEKEGYKRTPVPEFKPYFYAILTDNLGRIYVQRNMTWHEEGNIQKEVDVFSKDGYFLYRTKLPKDTYVIRDGYAYCGEIGDEEIVKRFKIKNWSAMKVSAEEK